MFVSIQHEIDLTYSSPISESAMDLRLAPRIDVNQTLHEFKLEIGPGVPVFEYLDWQGNRVHHFSILDSHDREAILARATVELHPRHWRLEQLEDTLPMLKLDHRHQDYLLPHGPAQSDPRLEQFARETGLMRESRASKALAVLMTRLPAIVTYDKTAPRYCGSSVTEVLTRGQGGAEDCTHVALSLLRLLGIPARYISGHLFRRGMLELDAHSWVEAFIPSVGWLGIDPTHGKRIGESHVALAIGRSHSDVPPRRGTFRGDAKQHANVSIHRQDIPLDHRAEGLRVPRVDNRLLVELMMRDKLVRAKSVEQPVLQ